MEYQRKGEIAQLILSWDEQDRIYAAECIIATLWEDGLERLEDAIASCYRYQLTDKGQELLAELEINDGPTK